HFRISISRGILHLTPPEQINFDNLSFEEGSSLLLNVSKNLIPAAARLGFTLVPNNEIVSVDPVKFLNGKAGISVKAVARKIKKGGSKKPKLDAICIDCVCNKKGCKCVAYLCKEHAPFQKGPTR